MTTRYICILAQEYIFLGGVFFFIVFFCHFVIKRHTTHRGIICALFPYSLQMHLTKEAEQAAPSEKQDVLRKSLLTI